MATFTTQPSRSARATIKPNIRNIKLGDGYEQRLAFGLNRRPEEWSLTFHARSTSERDTILDFLEARNGTESFDWTSPNGDAGKYVCEEWEVEVDLNNYFIISTTFRQVFEP